MRLRAEEVLLPEYRKAMCLGWSERAPADQTFALVENVIINYLSKRDASEASSRTSYQAAHDGAGYAAYRAYQCTEGRANASASKRLRHSTSCTR